MNTVVYKRTRNSYIIGFVLSLALTGLSFAGVMWYLDGTFDINRAQLIGGLLILAIAQLLVQLLFFFHLGEERRPRLNTMSFLFMAMVVLIIGLGSIWVMNNLNYNMMGEKAAEYILQDELPANETMPKHEEQSH